MNEEEILELIRTRLTIDAVVKESYNGGFGGGSMYTQHIVVKLLLDNEVISSVSLS